MGKIFDPPKPPPLPKYTPPPPPEPPAVPTAAEIEENRESEASEARKRSLLGRSRSRYGTILTGFTGFLSNSNDAEKKTLLGE